MKQQFVITLESASSLTIAAVRQLIENALWLYSDGEEITIRQIRKATED
jgi:hypothetical protein